MFGFSLVSLDADKVEPLVIIAAGGAFLWWAYTKSKANQAEAANANASANLVGATTGQVGNLALLQALFGTQATGSGTPNTQVTYSAPGGAGGTVAAGTGTSGTAAGSSPAPTTSGSSTSGTTSAGSV